MLFRESHPALHAIILVLFGFSAFSVIDAISKFLITDYSVFQISATLNLAAMVILVPYILKDRGLKGFHTKQLKLHLIRALVLTGITITVVKGLSYVTMADFYGIVFLAPFIVTIMGFLFLKEKVGVPHLVSIIIGFIGVLIIAGPQFSEMNVGVLYVFCAVIFISLGFFLSRFMDENEYFPLFVFYPVLVALLVTGPFALIDFRIPETSHLLLMIFQGACIILAHFGLGAGFARTPETAIVAPFNYVQMLWGVLLGYFMFGDVPTMATIIGSCLIIGPGLYLIWLEHKSYKASPVSHTRI